MEISCSGGSRCICEEPLSSRYIHCKFIVFYYRLLRVIVLEYFFEIIIFLNSIARSSIWNSNIYLLYFYNSLFIICNIDGYFDVYWGGWKYYRGEWHNLLSKILSMSISNHLSLALLEGKRLPSPPSVSHWCVIVSFCIRTTLNTYRPMAFVRFYVWIHRFMGNLMMMVSL